MPKGSTRQKALQLVLGIEVNDGKGLKNVRISYGTDVDLQLPNQVRVEKRAQSWARFTRGSR